MSDDAVRETEEQFWRLSGVSDVALEAELKVLLLTGARTEAHVVAHLAEVEVRRLHLRAGYRSLFEYCLVALGFSEFEAVFRISAARTARNFPRAFGMLERREIHLSGLHLLRNHLTPENHQQLLADARHKTKRQIAEQLAQQFPRANTPPSVRCLPKVEPLSADRYRLELTIDEAFKQKLERAAERLSHANPSHDLVVVLDRALDALLAQLDKGRFGRAAKPRSVGAVRRGAQAVSPNSSLRREVEEAAGSSPSHQPSPSRPHISRSVSRQVAERDEHRCTFTAADGRRCSAQAFLQLHHEQAWARGGPDTVENLRLLCAEHNRLHAEQDFGAARIRRAIDRRDEAPHHAETPSTTADDLPIPDKVA
jgi:hypothetical protein